MHARPSISVETAAQALAQWWEMAGLDPIDLSHVHRLRAQALKRTIEPSPPVAPKITPARATPVRKPVDALAQAHALAAACSSLDALEKALAGFDGCGLKAHARNLVFAGGRAGAPIMVVADAAGRDDDEVGLPFQGLEGELMARMLASIGIDKDGDCYQACLIPWRPPGGRQATTEEIAVCRPFLMRHIALAAPRALLLVGGLTAQAVLGTSESVMKLRTRSFDHPIGGEGGPGAGLQANTAYTQCLLSPDYLMKRPRDKAAAWQDLCRFRDKISAMGIALTGKNRAKG